MNWVATSERSVRFLGLRPGALVGGVLVAAAIAAGLLVAVQLVALPRYVDELIIENRTAFPLRVDVSDGDGESWLTVGTVQDEDTEAFSRVIDQGDVWLVRFHGQGRLGGHVRIDRAQLEDDGWSLVVPDTVADELRAQGAVPPP